MKKLVSIGILLVVSHLELLANADSCKITEWHFIKNAEKAYPDNAFSCGNALKSLKYLADKKKLGCEITQEENTYAIYTLKNIQKECPHIILEK